MTKPSDALPFMSIAVDDVLADFSALDDAERGALASLLFGCWAEGGSISADPKRLARRAGTDPARWADVWAAIGSRFIVDGETLTHPMVTAELARAREQRDARRRGAAATNAQRGAQRNAQRDGERSAERAQGETDSEAPSERTAGRSKGGYLSPSGSGSGSPDSDGGEPRAEESATPVVPEITPADFYTPRTGGGLLALFGKLWEDRYSRMWLGRPHAARFATQFMDRPAAELEKLGPLLAPAIGKFLADERPFYRTRSHAFDLFVKDFDSHVGTAPAAREMYRRIA